MPKIRILSIFLLVFSVVSALSFSHSVMADSYMGLEIRSYSSAEDLDSNEIAERALQVMQYARENGFTYGNSTTLPPCEDKIIACDRLAAAVLWSMGLTDQPRGGITLNNGYDSWLTSHGFERSEGISEIQRGSIVRVLNSRGIQHMFVVTDWDGTTMKRADAGSQGLIETTNQPQVTSGFPYDPDSAIVFNVPDKPKEEWIETDDGKQYYGTDGDILVDWQEIDGNMYFFGDDGIARTGKQEIEGDTYYFDEDGIMQSGLIQINQDQYYFDTDGRMKTGLIEIGGKEHYFGKDGKRKKGFTKVSGKTVYFDDEGLAAGWKDIDGKKYYFADDGEMCIGWWKIDGCKYYFDKKGILQEGWITVGGNKYYSGNQGIVTGLVKID